MPIFGGKKLAILEGAIFAVSFREWYLPGGCVFIHIWSDVLWKGDFQLPTRLPVCTVAKFHDSTAFFAQPRPQHGWCFAQPTLQKVRELT